MSKIQLAFYNSTLTDEEETKSEVTGMLILASDFMGSGKINKATKFVRMSKILFPIYLLKTKTKQYIPINPFDKSPTKLPIVQLPSLSEIREFCNVPENLDLNLLHDKLMEFQIAESELLGAYKEDSISVVEKLLQAPQDYREDFTLFPPFRTKSEIKESFKNVNEKVYDVATLKKAIKERLDIIEAALAEETKVYADKFEERTSYWKNEIINKNENLSKQIKAREKQLEKDILKHQKDTELQIEENLHKFLEGVSKNIRKDEKPIEKTIQLLEKLTDTSSKAEDIPKIERLLRQLADQTETFRAAVGFAQRQVKTTKTKEEDLRINHDLEVEAYKKRCELDKLHYADEADKIEKRRNIELQELKQERDVAATRLTKFKDMKTKWVEDIITGISTKTIKMISPALMGDSPDALVELLVPMYIFQYEKNSELYSIAVPPIQLPENFKKPPKYTFFGDKKTVYYKITVPESRNLLSNWLEKVLKERDMQTKLNGLPNLLTNPSELRDVFFTSQSLMIDKLKVDKKSIKKANDRLTEVWTSS